MGKAQQNSLKPHQSSMLWAGGLAVASFVVPILWWVTIPLQYLNTHIHELCHAVMNALSGGYVDRIIVHMDGSGLTWTGGGSLLLTASAGYCGATIVGAVMIACARTAKSAKAVMMVLGGILALSMIFWVRGDLIGILSGIFWVFTLLFAARSLDERKAVFFVQFLGSMQCLASLQSFLTLVHISTRPHDSDAQNMANASGIPAMFWAVGWFVFSVVLMAWTLRSAWRTRRTG